MAYFTARFIRIELQYQYEKNKAASKYSQPLDNYELYRRPGDWRSDTWRDRVAQAWAVLIGRMDAIEWEPRR